MRHKPWPNQTIPECQTVAYCQDSCSQSDILNVDFSWVFFSLENHAQKKHNNSLHKLGKIMHFLLSSKGPGK